MSASVSPARVQRLTDAYLAELGLDDERPSATALTRLHRAHVQRFAHDTLWKTRGRVPVLTSLGLVEALLSGEGGGCLTLNGSFGWLLVVLGYAVNLHGARVQRAFDASPRPARDAHTTLTVEIDDERWYADVGLGNGLLEPVPLRAGSFEQPGGFAYALEPSTDPEFGWRFHHDRHVMGLRTVESEVRAAQVEDFAEGFGRDTLPSAQRHIAVNLRRTDGVSSLTGPTLVRRGDGGRTMRPLGCAEEWETVLREEFMLGLPGWSTEERDRLWSAMAEGRP